jgi:hypothetical protein
LDDQQILDLRAAASDQPGLLQFAVPHPERVQFQRHLDTTVVNERVLQATADEATNDPFKTHLIKRNEQLVKEMGIMKLELQGLRSLRLRANTDGYDMPSEEHQQETRRCRELNLANSGLFARHIQDTQTVNQTRTEMFGYKVAYEQVVKAMVLNTQARGAQAAMSNMHIKLIQELSDALNQSYQTTHVVTNIQVVNRWMRLYNSAEMNRLPRDPANLNYTDLVRRYLELHDKVMVHNNATPLEKELFTGMEGQTGSGYPSTNDEGFTAVSAVKYASENCDVGQTWTDNVSERIYQIMRQGENLPTIQPRQ